MGQTIIVGIIVALAIIFVVRHYWKIAKGKTNGCGCGCSCGKDKRHCRCNGKKQP